MANKILTVFQNLDKAMSGDWGINSAQAHNTHVNTYDMSSDYGKRVIYKTKDKEEFLKHKLELQQNNYLASRWQRANVDLTVQAFTGLNNIKLMYRDAELMDSFPEIGAALDLVSEEAAMVGSDGNVVNVYSKSDRVKNVLEDLFTNRLDLQITAVMVIRAMCKYGNQFMLLDIDNKLGVKGWRQLPVYNVERLENGIENPYSAQGFINGNSTHTADMSTKFMWVDANNASQVEFRNWQVGHFRLLNNSLYLPYGVSYLNPARRHWRMLSLMEDMMLIYRLERSVERRVYKIFVGAIDDADVQSYVEEIANNFKRTPIIDPETGQVDLRKNILPVHKDTPIPLLDGRTTTIEELAKEYNEGKENFVYSVQDKTHQIVPGKVVWCGKNYNAEKLIKITLDDDTYCIMAPEHEVIMRDGSKKRADLLEVNESVMPFYRHIDKTNEKYIERYEKVYNPKSGKYEPTHRLVASCVEKQDEKFNTVHHKDFNKYNNSPLNLLWCDFYEHHKMHSQIAKNNWLDPIKRESTIKKLSEARKGQKLSEVTKEKISTIIKEKYQNGEMNHVREINSKFFSEYNKTSEAIEKRREEGIKKGYREEFKLYNESDLHKQHDEIRREASKNMWLDSEKREEIRKNQTVKFDDYVWEEINKAIIEGTVNSQNKLINYININLIDYLLSHNSSKKLKHYQKVTKPLVKARIVEHGFENFDEFFTAIKKNHKVKNIEVINGDDVYCMTVQGLNGEEDRHNFALCTWNEDGSVCQNGIFVSNCADQDIFIPVRDPNAATPIDTLSAGQNLTAMDDIKFVQNKVLTALRIPKSFLNFEEAAGDGKNLALMDIRFTRVISRIQQAFLMELTKIASIHLYLLGFDDELTNFSLTMNNPSTQAEQLEIENIEKKITSVRDAVADPGNGIPIMSLTRALKEIMKWSDKEIQENFEELRLEKALSAELEKTTQIIKKTGIFDTVDRMYGEPGAEYQEGQDQGQGMDDGMGGGGAPMGGGGAPMDFGGDDMGGELDGLGAPGAEDEGEIAGTEGEMPLGDENQQPMESKKSKKPLLTEVRVNKVKMKDFSKRNETRIKRAKIYDDALMVNEEFNNMLNSLNEILVENK